MLSEVLLTSLQITGIWIFFQDGMILHTSRYEGEKWTKPLYSCLICMASVWGTFFWLLEWQCEFNLVWFILGVLGVNTIINSVVDYFRNSPYFEK